MRTLKSLLARAVLGLGWLVFVTLALLFAFEHSGLLTSFAREIVASRAGSMGADIGLEHARLRWFEPALELEGLTLGAGGESLRFERTRLSFEVFQGRGARVDALEIEGGWMRIAPALINGVRGFAREAAERGDLRPGASLLPLVRVRDVQIDWETRPFGRIPLGKVDVQLRSDADGLPILAGRMVPSVVASAGGAGEIRILGQQSRAGTFDVRASASGLPLSVEMLPPGTDLEGLRPHRPRGELALDLEGAFGIDGVTLPRASARLSLAQASFVLAGGQSVDELAVDMQVHYAPRDERGLLDRDAWQARAQARGRVAGAAFESEAILGERTGPGLRGKCWIHMPQAPLTHAVLELFGANPDNEERWKAFDPRGTGELWAAIALPSAWTPAEPLAAHLEVGAELAFARQAGLTYNGWRNHSSGKLDMGFPLPLDAIEGGVCFALAPRRLRPAMVGLVGLSGDGGSSIIRAEGLITSPPRDADEALPGRRMAELELVIASEGLALDDRIRAALLGLSGVLNPASTWQSFAPADGTLDVELRLMRQPDMHYIATDLALAMHGVSLAWNGLPVPVRDARGKLRFRSDGHSQSGIALELEGGLRTAQKIGLALRFQTDPGAAITREHRRLDEISDVEIDVERIALTGDDRKILVAQYPDIGAGINLVGPKGFVDVHYRRVHAGPQAATHTVAEVTPLDPVQLQYEGFPMIMRDVRGRVLVTASQPHAAAEPEGSAPPAQVETRLMPLVGNWGPEVQVAFTASFPEDAVHIYGAGIDPSNKSLLGSLSQAIQSPEDLSGLDLSALSVEGRLDLSAVIQVAHEAQAPASSSYRLFLRGNALRVGNFRLDALQGNLELRDKVLYGDRLAARLARTPVELAQARFSTSAEGFRFETQLSARDVPLDREHLSSFLDADTLEALLGELRWRGRLDIDEGRVELSGPSQGESRLVFSGKVTPNDMFVQLGLPLAVRSATAHIDRLILEGGRVRAAGRISDLFGDIAGRALGPANLLFTYVEPRLSIEDLHGSFEGGSVLPLGEGAARGGTVFSIDLADPFPFQLALDLRKVDVAGLLRGLFPSNIATRGFVDAHLRLTGNTEDLLGIQGSGSVEVRDTRLWSVPVFRALFSQLGFDNTAVFDQMATNFRVREGVIEMNDIVVHSPLLQLVGKGTLDFDGGLSHDLEVRYDLVDRLGPLTRLFYSIQNKLLSVAIRGDMARPEVILKSPLTSWMRRLDERSRALPLPDFAPLPPRF